MAKFSFWRFFFSLKGRISRTAFAFFLVPERLLIWGANWLINRPELHLGFMQKALSTAVLGLIALLLLWPRYAVTVKRLQDCGLPSQLALIHLLQFAIAIGQSIWVLANTQPDHLANFHYWHLALTIIFYGILVGVFILCFVPGNKGINRFGPPPHRLQTATVDVF